MSVRHPYGDYSEVSIKDIAPTDRFRVPHPEERIPTPRRFPIRELSPGQVRDEIWQRRRVGGTGLYSGWEKTSLHDLETADWSSFGATQDPKGGWILLSGTVWGDYVGSTYERSNYEVFKETFASDRFRSNRKPNWLDLRGDFGACAILVAISWYLSPEGESLREWMGGLEDYSLADEDHHSELEMKIQNEDWESYACEDLIRSCHNHAIALDHPDADAFDEMDPIWPHVMSDNLGWCGTNGVFARAYDRDPPRCEDAVNAYWPVDDWAEDLDADDLSTLANQARALFRAWQEKSAYACLGCREKSAADERSNGPQERLFQTGEHESHYPGCELSSWKPIPGIHVTCPHDHADCSHCKDHETFNVECTHCHTHVAIGQACAANRQDDAA